MNTINGIDVATLHETIETIGCCPDLGEARFQSASEWQVDRRVRSTIQDYTAGGAAYRRPDAHVIQTDLPEGLLGTDRGPSPLELALSALTSCVTTTVVAHAAARGIPLESLHVEVVGDMDLQGFLDLSPGVRKGYRQLRLLVTARSTLPDGELSEFLDAAIQFSPVLDLFRHGTEVVIERGGA